MRSLFAPVALALLLTQPTQPALAQDSLAQTLFAQATPPAVSSLYSATSLATSLATSSATSSSVPLTLSAAIRMAFEYQPGLAVAARDIGITAALQIQAGVRPNPELSYLSEGLQSGRRTTTISISQAIELAGKRGARIASAQLDSDVALAELASYRSQLRADVVTAFFAVLVAQERMTLAQASQQLSKQVTGAAARRVLAGKISPVEETRARVAQANTTIELGQAGSELTLAKRDLAATWGSTNPLFDALVAPEIPSEPRPDSEELLALLPLSPQMVHARREIERQQSHADLERSRRLPDLTLSLGSKRDDELGRRQTVIGLSLPIPLFDRNQGNLQSALRRTDKARDELRAIEHALSVALAQAAQRRDAATAELAILQSDILPGAQSAYDAGMRGFELGKFSFLDVLDAQRTLFQAKTQYIGTLARSYRAAADIDRIVGNVGQDGQLMPASRMVQNQHQNQHQNQYQNEDMQ
jgi:cobalt-zinc-cadmium efflux system outer membrane protein